MKYYPLFLDLRGKEVLVVGAGEVAARKARGLLACGAKVTVVSPERSRELSRMGGVRFLRRRFVRSDLAGREIVVCATDDEGLNARIAAACREEGIWVNVVDRSALCTFIAPAVARRGDVTLAVSTGGASPALAAFLKRRLEGSWLEAAARTARLLKKYRPHLLALPTRERKRFLARILNDTRGPAAVERRLKGILQAGKTRGAGKIYNSTRR